MPKTRFRIVGIENVVKSMNAEVEKMKSKSAEGLINAAIEIRHATEKESPVTPLDLGNLRASFHITTRRGREATGGTFKGKEAGEMKGQHERITAQEAMIVGMAKYPTISLGYTANYATYVHEMPAGTKWSRPGSGHKWFERQLKRNHKKLLGIIRGEIKMER